MMKKLLYGLLMAVALIGCTSDEDGTAPRGRSSDLPRRAREFFESRYQPEVELRGYKLYQ